MCPIPGDGKQRASVTNCEDVAAMMSSVVGQEDKAAGQVFNCGTDSMLTYEELCHAVAKVAGKTAKVCVCARSRSCLDHAISARAGARMQSQKSVCKLVLILPCVMCGTDHDVQCQGL